MNAADWNTFLDAVDREDTDKMDPTGMHCCDAFMCD